MSDDHGERRRRYRRIDVPLLVQIRYSALDPPRTVYALNVSEGGVFLDIDDNKPLGTRVFIQITSPDGIRMLRSEGKVVRKAGGGTGVELVLEGELRDEMRAIIDSLD
jgi:c-di-GMP-binding flagellar brake protein YcgR